MDRTDIELMQNDVAELLRALGLGDHARPISCHDVIQEEILPSLREIYTKHEEGMHVWVPKWKVDEAIGEMIRILEELRGSST